MIKIKEESKINKVTLLINLLVILLIMTGCGDNTAPNNNTYGNPEETVESYWSAYSAGLLEEATNYAAEELRDDILADAPEQKPDLLRKIEWELLLANFNLTITGHDTEETTATVYAELTHPDFDQYYEDERIIALHSEPEYEEADEAILKQAIEEVLAELPEQKKETFNFKLTLIEEQWVITELPSIGYF